MSLSGTIRAEHRDLVLVTFKVARDRRLHSVFDVHVDGAADEPECELHCRTDRPIRVDGKLGAAHLVHCHTDDLVRFELAGQSLTLRLLEIEGRAAEFHARAERCEVELIGKITAAGALLLDELEHVAIDLSAELLGAPLVAPSTPCGAPADRGVT
jgi:hypothetical protein